MPLSLAAGGGGEVPILNSMIASLFVIDLSPQALEIEVAQCIGTETASLEVLVASDIRTPLQQVGYAGEDGGA